MEIRERLDIELSPQEKNDQRLVNLVLRLLHQKGYGAIFIMGKSNDDNPTMCSASIKFTEGLTHDGLITLMTGLNAHAQRILEERNERQTEEG